MVDLPTIRQPLVGTDSHILIVLGVVAVAILAAIYLVKPIADHLRRRKLSGLQHRSWDNASGYVFGKTRLGRIVCAPSNRDGKHTFVLGGTGSGKTTFLNALSNFIPGEERIITIEDSAELQIENVENLVSLETRNANTSGVGQVSMRDLIKASLRMRPERIIVGEVRGAEALDMLQAMNTGHDGSLSTGHANSASDMMSRLETMVLTGAEALPLAAVRQQIASAVDIVIHLSRLRDHSRKVTEISEVTGVKDGEIELNPIYVFEETSESTRESVCGELRRTENKFIYDEKLRRSGIDEKI